MHKNKIGKQGWDDPPFLAEIFGKSVSAKGGEPSGYVGSGKHDGFEVNGSRLIKVKHGWRTASNVYS